MKIRTIIKKMIPADAIDAPVVTALAVYLITSIGNYAKHYNIILIQYISSLTCAYINNSNY